MCSAPLAILQPQRTGITHLPASRSAWPARGQPWQVCQHAPWLYLCSPSCRRSQSPSSACMSSPGSRPASQQNMTRRRSEPGPRRPSVLPHPGLAAPGCRRTAMLVKARRPHQCFSWAEGKPHKPEATGGHSVPPICSPVLLLHPPALSPCLDCQIVPHATWCIT